MTGQLCWLPNGGNGELSLHLRLNPYQSWKPHTHFPQFCVPDYPMPKGSKGYATSLKLLQTGWTMVPTAEARRSAIDDLLAA